MMMEKDIVSKRVKINMHTGLVKGEYFEDWSSNPSGVDRRGRIA